MQHATTLFSFHVGKRCLLRAKESATSGRFTRQAPVFMLRARRCSTGNPMATFQDVVDSIAKAAGGQVKGADVGTILDANVGLDNQMEWRYSIVDLLKVLGLDS